MKVLVVLCAVFCVAALAHAQNVPKCKPLDDPRWTLDSHGAELITRSKVDDSFHINFVDLSQELEQNGPIEQWQLFVASSGYISMQVWRRVAPMKFELVGENVFEAQPGKQAILVPTSKQIEAKAGDYIGWRQEENGAKLYYDETGPGSVKWTVEDDGCCAGEQRAFSTGASRTYSIVAKQRVCAVRQCHNDGTLNAEECSCACKGPWTGLDCTECKDACVHGSRDNTTCGCTCDKFWSGNECTTCTRKCQHGGDIDASTCMCNCKHPFEGSSCEKCSLKCQNNGINDPNTCFCICPPNMKGEVCTDRVVHSLSLNSANNVDLPVFKNMPDKALTVEFWVKSVQARGSDLVYYYGNFPGSLRIFGETNVMLSIGAIETGLTNVSIADGAWHHLALTWVAETGKTALYVDGCPKWVQDLGKCPFLPSGGHLVVGNRLDGLMTEFRIWNFAKTEQQILDGISQSLDGREPGMALLWSLDQDDGNKAIDRTMNHNNGNIWGGADWVKQRPVDAQWVKEHKDSLPKFPGTI